MFDLTQPWWELMARAALIYLVLMVMVRASGKRTVGQFTPFDLLVVMLLSESVSSSLTGGEESIQGGLVAAATLVGLNLAMGFLTTRTRRAEDVVEGKPVLIVRDGVLLTDVLRHHRLGQGEWEKALREADAELEEVRRAFLETDGTISVLKKKEAKPGD